MQPQGTANINVEYFANLTAQVRAINVCADLQIFVDSIIPDLQALIDAINVQIALLAPLIVLPTDLASVIKWITAFAQSLILPYEQYAAQLIALAAQIADLIQAIEDVVLLIPECAVTIPALTGLPA